MSLALAATFCILSFLFLLACIGAGCFWLGHQRGIQAGKRAVWADAARAVKARHRRHPP